MLTSKNKKFYLDGKEFKIQSGTVHYFRSLPEEWEDILLRLKAAGLNCVETYTCWNLHEPKRGQFNFSGNLDVVWFLKLADDLGLKVILRPSPFICSEVDAGGFPAWTMKKKYNTKFRCNTEPYMTFVREWTHVLMEKIRPFLDSNGGPIIAFAIENEYGSFGDDFAYLEALEEMYRAEGVKSLFLAADGHTKYHISTGRSGTHVIQGIDFGPSSGKEKFVAVDYYDPDSPYLALEYWDNAFTQWEEEKMGIHTAESTAEAVNCFVDLGASFNLYMFHGGTNYGFLAGSLERPALGRIGTAVTSYQDSPLTEWGGYTEKYMGIKKAMERDHGKSDIPMPKSKKLQTIGKVQITMAGNLFNNLHIGKTYQSVTVEPMEEFDQNFGYILYKKVFDYPCEDVCDIRLCGLRDRAIVMVNREVIATLQYGLPDAEEKIALQSPLKQGDVVEILVENMGRVHMGWQTHMPDRKGITEAVLFSNKVGFHWEITTLELDDITGVNYQEGTDVSVPAFFRGEFSAIPGESTMVRFDNFKKGVIFVNGFNLGRYWEKGPQKALYLPGAILKEENEIVIFETDGLRGEPEVVLDDSVPFDDFPEEIIVE